MFDNRECGQGNYEKNETRMCQPGPDYETLAWQTKEFRLHHWHVNRCPSKVLKLIIIWLDLPFKKKIWQKYGRWIRKMERLKVDKQFYKKNWNERWKGPKQDNGYENREKKTNIFKNSSGERQYLLVDWLWKLREHRTQDGCEVSRWEDGRLLIK